MRATVCARVSRDVGANFIHKSNEISTFSILTIPIIYKSINISKEISIVLRYVDLIKHFGALKPKLLVFARGVFSTRLMVFQ